MQAILLYMSLEVGRATEGSTLRAAVGGLVSVDPLVGTEATLVGQQHLAHLACLGKNTKKAAQAGATGPARPPQLSRTWVGMTPGEPFSLPTLLDTRDTSGLL